MVFVFATLRGLFPLSVDVEPVFDELLLQRQHPLLSQRPVAAVWSRLREQESIDPPGERLIAPSAQ